MPMPTGSELLAATGLITLWWLLEFLAALWQSLVTWGEVPEL